MTDAYLYRETKIPRHYLRGLRRGLAPPKGSAPGKRLLASEDPRYIKLARLVCPNAEDAFLDALSARQRAKSTPSSPVVDEGVEVEVDEGTNLHISPSWRGTMTIEVAGKKRISITVEGL